MYDIKKIMAPHALFPGSCVWFGLDQELLQILKGGRGQLCPMSAGIGLTPYVTPCRD